MSAFNSFQLYNVFLLQATSFYICGLIVPETEKDVLII